MNVWKMMPFCRLAYLGVVAVLWALAAYPVAPACAAADGGVANGHGIARAVPVSDELDAVSRRAEEIYGLAKANRWKGADRALSALKKSEDALGPLQNEETNSLQTRLRKSVADLGESVAARKRVDVMRLANKITLIEAAMAEPLKPRVPTNVGLLDYYGRELEIWSEAKDMDRLSYTVLRMHLTWQTLIPKLEPSDVKVIKRFADILRRLDAAKAPEEYARLAAQVQDEVDLLEKSFRDEPSPGRPKGGAR